jgi:hypothetical protein
MAEYTLKALTDTDFSMDRTSVALSLDTDQGPIRIRMDATQLDHFVTTMQRVDQQLSPGEPVRFLIVDGLSVGNALVDNVPSIAVSIRSGDNTRAYAFNRQHAETLCRRVNDEVPSLDRLKTAEQRN